MLHFSEYVYVADVTSNSISIWIQVHNVVVKHARERSDISVHLKCLENFNSLIKSLASEI